MSAPRPIIHCPNQAAAIVAVRALYAMGYPSDSGRTLDQQLERVITHWDVYQAYPYVGPGGAYMAWDRTLHPDKTLVNSVSHLKAYMVRHRMVLTPGGPSA